MTAVVRSAAAAGRDSIDAGSGTAQRRPFRHGQPGLEPFALGDVAVDEDRFDGASVLVAVRNDDRLADALDPVAAPEPHLADPPAVLADTVEHLRGESGRLRGDMEDRRRLAEHRFLRITKQTLRARIPIENLAGQIGDDDAIEDVLESPGLAAQDLLHARAVGDVAKAPDPADNRTAQPMRLR